MSAVTMMYFFEQNEDDPEVKDIELLSQIGAKRNHKYGAPNLNRMNKLTQSMGKIMIRSS